MKSQNYIIKFKGLSVRDEGKLRKIQGEIDGLNFLNVLDNASLEPDPRDARKGNVTEEIYDTLETTPELFHYKSKGVLLSSINAEVLERQRIRVNAQEPNIEGILDGGHNTFAIALFLLDKLDEAKGECRRIKRWKQLKPVWFKYSDTVRDLLKDGVHNNFLVPIEIITTKDGEYDDFVVDILDIAQARNNNAQLYEETKANKAGYYDELKQYLDSTIKEQVEWRTNDGGRIKARDIIAMSMIPLSLIVEELTEGKSKINPVDIYSSKGKCVKFFNEIYKHKNVSMKNKDGTQKAVNPKFLSALKLTADIPFIYDMLLKDFPEAYNNVSPGYGRISSVGIYDPEKAKLKKEKGKYLRRPPKTKFSQKKLKYESPDGFIVPLLWGLTSLIKEDKEKLVWKVSDPLNFLKKVIYNEEFMTVYQGNIKAYDYDPPRVGKNNGSYHVARAFTKFELG
jgi:hypothetical protein